VPALGSNVFAQRPPFPSPDVSPADSLVVYVDMLRGVGDEFVARIAGTWQAAQSVLSNQIKDLRATVEQLATELAKTDIDAAARLLALAATGRGIELWLTGDAAGDPRPDPVVLTRFTEACRTCTQLAEAQNVVVTSRARQLVTDVIRMVRALESQNTITDAARSAFDAGFRRLQQDLDNIRDLLMVAATDATAESDPRISPEDARLKREVALLNLGSAKAKLAAAGGAEPSQLESLPRRKALIDVIEGTEKWLITPFPPGVASLVPFASGDGQAVIRTAERRQKLWDLLKTYSPAATLFREIYLYALLTPIWVGYRGREDRERLIREVLKVFPSTPPAWQSAAFVSELAAFV